MIIFKRVLSSDCALLDPPSLAYFNKFGISNNPNYNFPFLGFPWYCLPFLCLLDQSWTLYIRRSIIQIIAVPFLSYICKKNVFSFCSFRAWALEYLQESSWTNCYFSNFTLLFAEEIFLNDCSQLPMKFRIIPSDTNASVVD